MSSPSMDAVLSARPQFPQDLRVLLADSDAEAREEALQLLQQCSYSVHSVSTAAECIEALQAAQPPFDVVVIDIACLADASPQQSSALFRSSATPVVLTHRSDPSPLLHSLAAGAVDVLEKPLAASRCSTLWVHQVRRLLGNGPASAGRSSPYARSKSCLPTLGSPRRTAGTAGGSSAAVLRQISATAATLDVEMADASQPGPSRPTGTPAAAGGSHSERTISAGNSSGAAAAAAAGATGGGQESTSAASTSEHLRAATTGDLLASADVDAVSIAAGLPSASTPLHRLDSSQVLGLTTGLSHLSVTAAADELSQLVALEVELEAAGMTGSPGADRPGDSSDTAGLLDPEILELLPQQAPRPASTTPKQPTSTRPSNQPSTPGLAKGHPAGRLPDLPDNSQVWGLPTTPLHITPRVNSFPNLAAANPMGMGMGMGMPPMGIGMPPLGMGMGMGPGFLPPLFPPMGPLPPMGNPMAAMGMPPLGMNPMMSPMGAMSDPGLMAAMQAAPPLNIPPAFPAMGPTPMDLQQPPLQPTDATTPMGHGMIPTPLSAVTPPPTGHLPNHQLQKQTTPGSGSRASQRKAAAMRRAASANLPPITQPPNHPFLPPSGSVMPHVPSSGALLDPLAGLDPLSTLDTPLSTLDEALDPLDHAMLMSDHHGAATGFAGASMVGPEALQAVSDGMAASGAAAGNGGHLSVDNNDLEDWFMSAASMPDTAGLGNGGNGSCNSLGNHLTTSSGQPLGLKLHKSASLADMIMASLGDTLAVATDSGCNSGGVESGTGKAASVAAGEMGDESAFAAAVAAAMATQLTEAAPAQVAVEEVQPTLVSKGSLTASKVSTGSTTKSGDAGKPTAAAQPTKSTTSKATKDTSSQKASSAATVAAAAPAPAKVAVMGAGGSAGAITPPQAVTPTRQSTRQRKVPASLLS